MFGGLRKLLLLPENVAEIRVRTRMAGLDLDRFAISGNCLVCPAFPHQRIAKEIEGSRVVRPRRR